VLLYVVFIMIDYDRLLIGFKRMVPPRFRKVTYKLANDVKDSMNHYFRGQALIACFVAVIYCVGFSLCNLPLALLLGISTGVLFMIPYFQYLTIIPVTLLCLVSAANGHGDFWAQWWECVSVFVVVQIVADLILTPKIMGKAMGLNPAIILLSLSIWGSLFGLIGMIIALPLTTLILSYYDQYIIHGGTQKP
jgi:predicted PurR-regulated permease PerM